MVPSQVGKGVVRKSGKDVALVGYGQSVNECLAAAEMLQKVSPCHGHGLLHYVILAFVEDSRMEAPHSASLPADAMLTSGPAANLQAGVSATVVDARFCKPLDTQLLRQLAQQHPAMITVEEGSVGGFAAHVMQVNAIRFCPPLGGVVVPRVAAHPRARPVAPCSSWRWRACWMGSSSSGQ
jgi:1-deoxy-D-xylulose-5-phosphate synthase